MNSISIPLNNVTIIKDRIDALLDSVKLELLTDDNFLGKEYLIKSDVKLSIRDNHLELTINCNK